MRTTPLGQPVGAGIGRDATGSYAGRTKPKTTDGCPKGGTATTLAGPRRCPYCGHRCHGRTCRDCQDLGRAERAVWRSSTGDDLPTMRDELRTFTPRQVPPFRATCPRPECGELAKPGRKFCASCRTALYPTETHLAGLRAGKYSGAKP